MLNKGVNKKRRQAIIRRIKKLKLSQTKVAELSHLTQPRVSQYLAGYREMGDEPMKRLTDALGLDFATCTIKKK